MSANRHYRRRRRRSVRGQWSRCVSAADGSAPLAVVVEVVVSSRCCCKCSSIFQYCGLVSHHHQFFLVSKSSY